ncbi:MAG: DNA gyrase inhibitor YacG [Hyphomicrobiaceae bacterium]|nr:DNA gyrase inhibitor YacG [Hyphomicrobiaceae bacterium]
MGAQRADKGSGRSGKCPICGQPSDAKYIPFCSRRCADVDLSRWLSGAYAIPDKTESEDGRENAEPPRETDQPESDSPGS